MSAILKTIHVACRQLGLDEETRRDMQLVATGKSSLRDMTAAEQQLVLDALKARGFQSSSCGTSRKGWRNPASRRDVRLCHVLWGKLVRAGEVQVPGATGLNAFIRARFEAAWGAVPIDIDSMRDWKQIASVIEALKGMCRRAGIKA